ncbi:MAG: 1-phosphofructokinase [Actinomycetota bacterium]|nr:1-phosphofructokinase [Actinomycetota bacterium]
MIVTLTLNPSVDRTVEVEALVRGAVLRATSATVDAGGKGVNISRALAANGHPSRAVLISGGAEGAQLAGLLFPLGIEVVNVPVRGAVRANVSIVEPDGTVTKINEPGPVLSADEVESMTAAILEAAAGATWVAASGSLPPGVANDFYRQLIERLAPVGARVALDTSGEALQLALPGQPDVVKPNSDELAQAVGAAITTLGDVIDAAERLREKGARAVLASLGSDGAVLVDDRGVTYGEAPVDLPRSAVGAGDAMLAGFLAAGGKGLPALVEALAWGAAATRLPGSRMPGSSEINREVVRVYDHIDQSRVLKGQR